MIKIITVCGNGIGSSLMLAGVIKKLCKEWNIDINIKSSDLMTAKSESADFFITAKRLATELKDKEVIVIRSYTNIQKISDDIKEQILNFTNKS
ncbi:PTS sugar transporter subunit IIB [Psychromonas sp. SA13A]|uniref:PTS sugar transporter subunit IIB n=1 Tax=Psychromonas sp. SA13A TaxID=2686346 RepID=UPI00140C214B|nr:PTS sugar transporter subunit IIB [Psychromonas sp. SA13A]